MKSIVETIYDRAFAADQEITDELVDYYENYPDELDLIIEEEEFHARFLTLFFFLGLGVTIVSRVALVLFENHLNEFVKVVVLDVLSEVGIAIFGGTLVAYFIEFLKHKQFRKNKEFRDKVKQLINERNTETK